MCLTEQHNSITYTGISPRIDLYKVIKSESENMSKKNTESTIENIDHVPVKLIVFNSGTDSHLSKGHIVWFCKVMESIGLLMFMRIPH